MTHQVSQMTSGFSLRHMFQARFVAEFMTKADVCEKLTDFFEIPWLLSEETREVNELLAFVLPI